MKECSKSSQRQQEVLKVAPSDAVTKKKKNLCSPNEVFQKWITPLSAKKKISYELLNLKWSPF